MTPRLLKRHVPLTDETRALLESSMDQMNFSARAHDRILKVARTIADLAQSPDVTPTTSSKPSTSARSIGITGCD